MKNQILRDYELKADKAIKKPWHKYFTSLELVVMFFGSALFYILLNIIYFEFLKYIILK